MSFAESYLGRLRAAVGSVPLLSIGVRVLIADADGRFLILKRADDGLWGVPGGAMELGESLMEAAHREAFEETNAELLDLTPFGLSSDPVHERHIYPNGDETQSISLLTHARLGSGALRANDGEAVAFRMTHPAEIDPETFCRPEFPIFAHWQRWQETGVFQVV